MDIEVRVDDVLMLRAGSADDGHPDADEVWRRLTRIELKPTDEFLKKYKNSEEKTLLLRGRIVLSIEYGGKAEIKLLKILRSVKKDGAPVWMIEPSQVKSYFATRLLRRDRAASLNDPKATE